MRREDFLNLMAIAIALIFSLFFTNIRLFLA
jgi:hypothetical protein